MPAIVRDLRPELDEGPVLVTLEYRVNRHRSEEFLEALHEYGRVRRRDGAYVWGLFEDAARPGSFLEYFLVVSWLEHLRQHERSTLADRDVQQHAAAFHIDDSPPVVEHFLAPVEVRAQCDESSR